MLPANAENFSRSMCWVLVNIDDVIELHVRRDANALTLMEMFQNKHPWNWMSMNRFIVAQKVLAKKSKKECKIPSEEMQKQTIAELRKNFLEKA